MRQKKYHGMLLLMLGTLVFGGCQEAPYELTEKEEALIVSYSAHVVSKYNVYQKDGLIHVWDEEEETKKPEDVTTEADTEKETSDAENIFGNSDTGTQESVKGTLRSIYEDTGLNITYKEYEIADSYMDGKVYAAKPSVGKKFLILHISVENPTNEAITFNNFGSGTSYSVKFNDEEGNGYHTSSVISLVSNEFSTYEGVVEAQKAVDMVLLFEIPQKTTEIDSLILRINKDEKVFEINL